MIRQGSAEDIPKIEEINKVVFGEPCGIAGRAGSRKDFRVSVAEENGRILGYVCGHERKGKYYLWMGCVLPEARNKGIGTALLKHQMNVAVKAGYTRVFAKSSNKWKPMMRLLLKMGFDVIGYKAREWGDEAAVWFEKVLQEG